MRIFKILTLLLLPILCLGQALDLPHAIIEGASLVSSSHPNYTFSGTINSDDSYSATDFQNALAGGGKAQITFLNTSTSPNSTNIYTVTAVSNISGNDADFTVVAANGTPTILFVPSTMEISQVTANNELLMLDAKEGQSSFLNKANHNFNILENLQGGGGNSTIDVTSTGHGFTLPTSGILFVTYDGVGGLEIAKADQLANVPTWAVVAIPDANTLTLGSSGIVTVAGGHGLAINADYFLQNDGSLGTSDLSTIKLGTLLSTIDANSYTFDIPEVVFGSLTQGILEAGVRDTDEDTRIQSTEGVADMMKFSVDNNEIMQLGTQGLGIGTTSGTTAILELNSVNSGFVPPRMTNTQRDAIVNKIQGMTIYSTTDSKNYVWNGSNWYSSEVSRGSTFPAASTNYFHFLVGNAILPDGIYSSDGTTWSAL